MYKVIKFLFFYIGITILTISTDEIQVMAYAIESFLSHRQEDKAPAVLKR